MHLLLSHVHGLFAHGMAAQLSMMFSCLAMGAFAFTLVRATPDEEVWTWTSLIGDNTGDLVFRNTNYRIPPKVWFVPGTVSVGPNGTDLTALTALQVTMNQTPAVGAGGGTIYVQRFR